MDGDSCMDFDAAHENAVPFPGMDPYLEASSLGPDVPHEWLSGVREILNRRLRPQDHVRVEQRVDISDENDPGRKAIIPDSKNH